MPILPAGMRTFATQLASTNERCSPFHKFHRSWNCKRVGSPETLAGDSSARMAIKSRSFSSASGTVKPDRIFAMRRFGSMAAKQCTVASKSICSTEAGSHTVTRRIQHSNPRCFTCSSRGVIVRFSRAHFPTGTCRRSALIHRIWQERLIRISHSHIPGDVRRH